MLDVTQRRTITIIAVLSLLFGAYFLWGYFNLIALSIIITFLFNPIYLFYRKKFKRPGTASALAILTAFVTLVVPLTIILALTAQQAASIAKDVENIISTSGSTGEAVNTIVSQINDTVKRIPGADSFSVSSDSIISFLKDNLSNIASYTVNLLKGAVGGIASFFTLLIIFLFVLSALFRGQDTLTSIVRRMNPLGDEVTDLYFNKAGAMTGAMVRGQFIIAIAQGAAEAGFLWVLGYDYFFFMFIIFSLLSIIPLGAGIIVIPFAIVLILTGDVVNGLLILGYHFLVVTNIDNVLRPRLVPKEARLNPALTILAVFAGIDMFGFIGIVIGPVIMILIVTTIRVYLELKTDRKNTVKVSQNLKKH